MSEQSQTVTEPDDTDPADPPATPGPLAGQDPAEDTDDLGDDDGAPPA